jgi:hypothetical protein
MQLRIPSSTLSLARSRTAPTTKGRQMRIFESAAAGIIALAAQVLVIATVLI